MSRRFDHFLRHFPVRSASPSLGRVFAVTRESWKLTDDPVVVKPKRQLMISGHTASEAADFARFTAESFDEHGFHKPSGAWWASDGELFHRFAVHAGRRRASTPVLIGAGVAGVAGLALAVLHFSGRGRRDKAGAS